jgi:hypothetical protein
VAFAWHPVDLDGPQTVTRFLYWMTRNGGAPTDTFYTADTLVALQPIAFGPPGEPEVGTWTLNVMAEDESHTRSRPISHTWDIFRPNGDYLLIDNVSDNVPGALTEDNFFRAMMDSVVAGNYHVMDIQNDGGFRTGVEVGPFLSLFKAVLWYSGMQNPFNDAVVARNLGIADQGNGLRSYLAGGGRVLLCAQNAVGDSAGLSHAFQREILGVSNYYRMQDLTSQEPDYINGNIPLLSRSVVYTTIAGAADSLLTSSSMVAADFLVPDPDITPIFTVTPGYLQTAYKPADGFIFTPDDQLTYPAALGILSERQGRMAVSSLIPSRANGFQTRDRITQALIRRVFF